MKRRSLTYEKREKEGLITGIGDKDTMIKVGFKEIMRQRHRWAFKT